ncbi:peptidoglycan-binding protein, partial [Patescibacteria group bacterium]|nr:peptidoglycan-binding protein [Patescibacteria group bacterium]
LDDTEQYETGEDMTTNEAEQSVLGEKITSPSYFFISFLSLGFQGEEVRQLQTKLKELNFFPKDTTPNGIFGPTTETAVKAFQTANGLDAVGYVGPSTRDALNNI